MKVYAEVYGCSANKSDFELAMGLLKQNNFEIVSDASQADINVIFTCAVKGPTVNRMINRINKLKSKPLVVAGCMTKTEKEVIERLAPEASLIGPNNVADIVQAVQSVMQGKKFVALNGISKKPNLPKLRLNKVIDIVQISTGCLSFCTFCATKLARGNLHSFRPNDIREAVKQALNQGCKEIWLTSQDSSAYGRDINVSLADLLTSINNLPGDFMVRVGMMNPLHFKKQELKELVKAFSLPKIFKFLHLCVQSGSNKVLQDMKRGYTKEDFISYVEAFRQEIPEITLATDVIVGYPTETEQDFEQTYELIKEIKPDIVNISRFWARKGTEAAKLKKLPDEVVMARSKKMYKLVRKIALQRNKKWIGWQGKALVDEIGKQGTVMARNYAYKPIVLQGDESLLGKFVEVKIKQAKSNYLIASLA